MTNLPTDSLHPLDRFIHNQSRAVDAAIALYRATAGAIIADHRTYGASDQSVYEIVSTGDPDRVTWKRVGSTEDYGHLLSQPEYIAVRTGRPGSTSVDGLAVFLGGATHASRAVGLRTSARAAAPLIDAALAVWLSDGKTWDTGETIAEAALRLAKDAALCMARDVSPAFPDNAARHVYARAAGWLHLPGDATAAARTWLERRTELSAAVADAGAEWGGTLLTGAEIAELAGISPHTWSAYVSRGEAPAADVEGRWRRVTVLAWQLTRRHATKPVGW